MKTRRLNVAGRVVVALATVIVSGLPAAASATPVHTAALAPTGASCNELSGFGCERFNASYAGWTTPRRWAPAYNWWDQSQTLSSPDGKRLYVTGSAPGGLPGVNNVSPNLDILTAACIGASRDPRS